MSLNVTFNGSNYIIPETGEKGWGGNTTSYLVAIAAGALQKTGGSFTLSAETDFGASFGLKSLYYKSRSTNIAASGIVRLNNNSDAVSWRNAANSADLPLTVDASNRLSYNGVPVLTGTGPSDYVSSITGTANQVNASASTGAVTLSLPQSINTSAAVQFGTLGLGSAIVASSLLSLTSTTAGFLTSRMTTAQRNAISSPATGLLIYNTDTNQYDSYNGTSWVALAMSGGGTVNAGIAGRFSYYPANGTTVDDQALLTTDLTNLTLTSGQWLSPAGTAALPTYSYTGDPNTGLYLSGTDEQTLVTGGSASLRVENTVVRSFRNFIPDTSGTLDIGGTSNAWNRILLSNGTGSVPSFTFAGDLDTGMYLSGANELSFTTNSTQRFRLTSAGSLESVGGADIKTADGSVTAPGYTFTNDTNTGIYRIGTDHFGFATAGTLRWQITDSGVLAILGGGTAQLLAAEGTAAAPSYSFNVSGATDDGIYGTSGGGLLQFSVGGSRRGYFSPSIFSLDTGVQIQAPDGSAATPEFSFFNDPDTGLYRSAANVLSLSLAGAQRLELSGTAMTWKNAGSHAYIYIDRATTSDEGLVIFTTAGVGTNQAAIGLDNDTTNNLNLYTGGNLGTPKIIITPDGEMTRPLQPSFLVHPSATASDVTGDGTVYTVTWGTEIFDQGGDFASNTFTAPVTGRYLFCVHIDAEGLSQANHNSADVNLVTSNGTYNWQLSDIPTSVVRFGFDINTFADMDAGDTATVTFVVGGASKVVDVNASGRNLTRFSGSLIN